MNQKLIALFFCLIYFSFQLDAQKVLQFDKINIEYFKDLGSIDTNDVYIICDELMLDFKYSKTPPAWTGGANDGNFVLNLERLIRIKINNQGKHYSSEIPIVLSQGEQNKNKIRNCSFFIYNIENNKLNKIKVKRKELEFTEVDSTIVINLEKYIKEDSSIIDISYEIYSLSKEYFKWIYYNDIYVHKCMFFASIPEIYDYEINYCVESALIKEYSITEFQGVEIGYGQRGNLVSEQTYKNYQKALPTLRLPVAYCRYYINAYEFMHLIPNRNSTLYDWIELKLKNIDPIN